MTLRNDSIKKRYLKLKLSLYDSFCIVHLNKILKLEYFIHIRITNINIAQDTK